MLSSCPLSLLHHLFSTIASHQDRPKLFNTILPCLPRVQKHRLPSSPWVQTQPLLRPVGSIPLVESFSKVKKLATNFPCILTTTGKSLPPAAISELKIHKNASRLGSSRCSQRSRSWILRERKGKARREGKERDRSGRN